MPFVIVMAVCTVLVKIATLTAAMVDSGVGASQGVLIKGGRALGIVHKGLCEHDCSH